MSYYNQQQQHPVGVPPMQGYPNYQGDAKDAYPPPGYPSQGYAQGYPPQQYAQQPQYQHHNNNSSGSGGMLQGCLAALCCCCLLDACF